MAAEQENKTVPIGWISPDKSCRVPPRIGPTPLPFVGGVLFPPSLNMVRFVGQPAAAAAPHLPVYNKELKGRQNDQLQQHQYCPMFQPLTFRDLSSVMIANVPKSPIDLSLFRLVRPSPAYAYPPPPPPVDNNDPENCGDHLKRSEAADRDCHCPTSEQATVVNCSSGTTSRFGCDGAKFTAEAESTENGCRAASRRDDLSAVDSRSQQCESPVDRRHITHSRRSESMCGEVESDRASMGSSDNEDERLAGEDGMSMTTALDVETIDKSPPPLVASSAILTESASEDEARSERAPSPRRKRPRRAWTTSRRSPPQSVSDDSVVDERHLFKLLQDLDDRSETDEADVLRSPVALSSFAFYDESQQETTGSGSGTCKREEEADSPDEHNEMSDKKVLRNATDERVVAKLYGTQPVTRDRVHLIGQMPVAELNSLIQQANMTEAEASLVRDIRRRSKNKVAARNCRKRKLDTISQLESEVNELHAKRARLEQERDRVRTEALRYKQCVHALRRFIVKSLRKEAAAALANTSSASGQLLNSEGINEFVSAMSNSASFSGSQSDLFTSAFTFDSPKAKPDSVSTLSPLIEESPTTSLPIETMQPSSSAEVTPGLNRYASVSSLTTEPPQFSSSVNTEAMACNPSMAPMAHPPFSAMPMLSSDIDTLASLFPPQPAPFPQAPAAPVGINIPYSSWNTALFY